MSVCVSTVSPPTLSMWREESIVDSWYLISFGLYLLVNSIYPWPLNKASYNWEASILGNVVHVHAVPSISGGHRARTFNWADTDPRNMSW